MIRKLPLLLLLAAPLALACNPALVKEGDPLHQYVGKEYYLARPLSGPKYRTPNLYGEASKQPRLKTGTKVTVQSIERALPVFRIYFKYEKCPHGECMAHWREPDDAAFEKKFNEIFSPENPLEKLDAKVRDIVEKSQVAGNMTQEEVRLSIGDPNRVVDKDGKTRWIYERRACDAKGRLVAIPHIALVFDGDRLDDFENLDASEWYVTKEPVNKLSGLCEGVTSLPEDTPIAPAQSGDMGPNYTNENPGNTDLSN